MIGHMKKWLFAAAALLLASCSSTKKIQVVSNPPGATVRIDGVKAGVTPTTVEVNSHDTTELIFEKSGYYTQSYSLVPETSTLGTILWTDTDEKSRTIKEDRIEVTLYKYSSPSPKKASSAPAKNTHTSPPPALRSMPSFL